MASSMTGVLGTTSSGSGSDSHGAANPRADIPMPEYRGAGDPFANLLENLPGPETDYLITAAQYNRVDHAFRVFLQEAQRCINDGSTKWNFYVGLHTAQQHGKRRLPPSMARLVEYALSTPVAESDDSLTARHLRYLRWAGEGRKDQYLPFVQLPRPEYPSHRVDVKFLPRLVAAETFCAACGTANPKILCQACSLYTGEIKQVTIGTFYCGDECSKRHHGKHKASCRATGTLVASTFILEKILEGLMANVCDPSMFPSSFAQEGDILKIEYQFPTKSKAWGYSGLHVLSKCPSNPHWDPKHFWSALIRDATQQLWKEYIPLLDFIYFIHGMSPLHA